MQRNTLDILASVLAVQALLYWSGVMITINVSKWFMPPSVGEVFRIGCKVYQCHKRNGDDATIKYVKTLKV